MVEGQELGNVDGDGEKDFVRIIILGQMSHETFFFQMLYIITMYKKRLKKTSVFSLHFDNNRFNCG